MFSSHSTNAYWVSSGHEFAMNEMCNHHAMSNGVLCLDVDGLVQVCSICSHALNHRYIVMRSSLCCLTQHYASISRDILNVQLFMWMLLSNNSWANWYDSIQKHIVLAFWDQVCITTIVICTMLFLLIINRLENFESFAYINSYSHAHTGERCIIHRS